MRYAAIVLALHSTAASMTIDISSESLVSEILPLYAVGIVIFGTAALISAMFRRHRGLLVLGLSRGSTTV